MKDLDLNDKKLLEKKLNKKQRRFCEEYIKQNYNATKAAKAAGYSEKTARSQGSRLLTNVDITAYTRILQKIEIEKSGLSNEFVVLRLLEVLDKCMGGEPVKEWDSLKHDYVEKGAYTFDSKGATRALESLGKTLGMFGAKIDDKTEQKGVVIKFESPDGKDWGG